MTATTTSSAGTAVERPDSVDAAAALLRDSEGPLLFRGAGTKIGWGGRPRPADLVVETTGMTRLLAHNPGDMTASVQAGMPLSELQGILGQSGQWLALDPPSESAGATVGGLLVSGDSGPRRLRYGAMRDLVIGVTLVLADGTVARSGGHVIKNVAGYDLSKLLYGSLGSLAFVAEVVLRLHPRPETSATLAAAAPVDRAGSLALGLMSSALEPAAIDWAGTPDEGRLLVRFEGSSEGVAAQTAALHQLLGDGGLAAEHLADAEQDEAWAEMAGNLGAAGDVTTAYAGTLPSRSAEVSRALADAAGEAGVQARLASHLALGLHTARLTGPPEGVARAFEAWREKVRGLGGSVSLRDRPDEVDAALDALGPPPSAVQLLRAVKSKLDPGNRCAPGRFGSWY